MEEFIMGSIKIKRIYDPYDEADGNRILIDRLWPRGISKEKAQLTSWMKELGPSNELRKWFGHKPELFEEFRMKYIQELHGDKTNIERIKELCTLSKDKNLTLLYAAKDPEFNNAAVLKEELFRYINK
jgi:uncharacterized protein YeaO (DUF488 family)